MKQMILLIAICVFSVNLAWAQSNCPGGTCLPAKVKDDCTTRENKNGCIDWTNGIIYATGMGIPNSNVKSKMQRRYSAEAAAVIIAEKNLLKMIQGINIDSKATVKMGMLEEDIIIEQYKGTLFNVLQEGKARFMNDDSAIVTMKMYMRDVVSILMENNHSAFQQTTQVQKADPEKPKTPEGSEYGGSEKTIYTGLIIDARGMKVVPAMSPKVYDNEQKEIYGSAAVERNFALQHGIVGYIKDLKKAQNNDRVKGNPLLIKAINSQKAVDLIISEKDAELLNKLNTSQTFLREARVMIVLD